MTEQQLFEKALLDLLLPPTQIAERLQLRSSNGVSGKKKLPMAQPESDDISVHRRLHPAEVIEHTTSRTIAVRWSDPRSGYYGEQIWILCRSKKHTHCAATGALIHPGDTAFRPTATRMGIPFNQGWLILASAIGHVPSDIEVRLLGDSK
ncbi:DUF3331 domain-containing protein [Paraburkholderia sp. 32]|uniref:DUF3331 domain-containing protein n=1 Tax=Paraburkholderia sp. 32 TaxID=2991057 RepID=UPI003D1CFA98